MDVSHRDPRQAVVAELTAPTGYTPPKERFSDSDDPVPRASVMSHGPYAADPDAIEFLKERARDDRHLFAVTFDDPMGNRWFWLVAAERTEQGWAAHGVAGGSDGPARAPGEPSPIPSRSAPWLNLCGQWGGDSFYAGGQLHSGSTKIARVQITLADGSQLVDDGTAGVALFIGRHGEPPASVEIFAVDGTVLSSRSAF
jgi:hypothetical protein